MDTYDDSYSEFYGDWDMKKKCVKNGKGNAEMECCGGNGEPYAIFNAKRFDCCSAKGSILINLKLYKNQSVSFHKISFFMNDTNKNHKKTTPLLLPELADSNGSLT